MSEVILYQVQWIVIHHIFVWIIWIIENNLQVEASLTSFAFFHFRNAAHGFSLIPVDSLKVTMKEILQKALKKRKGSQKGSGNATFMAYSL